MLGLYIHIPFCSSICNYCNFNRGLYDEGLKNRYVQALLKEIRLAGDGASADSIFFGGGTPSLLEPVEVASIIKTCQEVFSLSPGTEITLEANPETVSLEKLIEFQSSGVTRLSCGVQSFRNDELVRLSRLHSANCAREAVASARAAGFNNVSLDLMMWLPEQSISQWLESVDSLIELEPDHASLYLLELYPGAPLREEMTQNMWNLAPDDDAADMYLEGMEKLDTAGYHQYEISNVAKPDRESRHNLKYWTDGEWLGFGCGAHSTRDGVRWMNRSGTEDYIDAVKNKKSVSINTRKLTKDEQLEEALFTGLRLVSGVNLDKIRHRYGVDVWAKFKNELQVFLDRGLLSYDQDCLRLTRHGMLLSHEVMRVFVG